MYRKTVNYLRGSVRLRVESSYPERVINLCAAHGVPFWGLQWESETVFHVRTTRHSLPLLRQITQEVECTVTMQEERGAPVLLCRGGSIPHLRMPSLLPHDLCPELNASPAPGT